MASADEKKLRTVDKLHDVQDLFEWHSLKIPELEKLPPRVGHAIISVTPGRILMIGGGNHNGVLQDVYSINLQPQTSENSDNDSERVTEHPGKHCFIPRYEFFCAKDDNQRVFIFGGADTKTTMNDILVIDGNEIVEIVQSNSGDAKPSGRTQGSNSALIERNGKKYMSIYAGGLKGEQPVQDRNLYLFDTDEHTWEVVNVKIDEKLIAVSPFGCQPPAVQGHAVVSSGSKIFVHGGINGTTLYGGLHWIDVNKESENSSCCWKDSDIETPTAPKPPSARAAHGLAKIADVDKNSPFIYMFGGIGESGARNDLWSLNVESNTWTEVLKHQKSDLNTHPQARLSFAMCAVSLNDEDTGEMRIYLMIHGGMNPQGDLFNDAWIMRVK